VVCFYSADRRCVSVCEQLRQDIGNVNYVVVFVVFYYQNWYICE